MTERRAVGWSAATILMTALIVWLFTPSSLFAVRLLFRTGDLSESGAW